MSHQPSERFIHSAVSESHPSSASPPTPQRHAAATSISLDEVRKVASLSRLALSDADLTQARHDLAAVLAYMTRLNQLDLSKVEPLRSISGEAARLDDDLPGPTLSNDQLLALAPDTMPPFIKVPKVMGEGNA